MVAFSSSSHISQCVGQSGGPQILHVQVPACPKTILEMDMHIGKICRGLNCKANFCIQQYRNPVFSESHLCEFLIKKDLADKLFIGEGDFFFLLPRALPVKYEIGLVGAS